MIRRRSNYPSVPNLDREFDDLINHIIELTGKKVDKLPLSAQTPEMARFIKKVTSDRYEEYIKVDGGFRLLGGGSGGSGYIELRVDNNSGYIQWRNDANAEWVNLIALTELKGEDGAAGTPGVGVPTGGTTGQVLKKASNVDYDTVWQDESAGGSGEANTASNVGTGEGLVFKEKVGVDLRFKSIKQGNGIIIQNNVDDITLNGKTLSNIGDGATIIKQEVGNNYELRSIKGSDGVQIDYVDGGNSIRISIQPLVITSGLLAVYQLYINFITIGSFTSGIMIN